MIVFVYFCERKFYVKSQKYAMEHSLLNYKVIIVCVLFVLFGYLLKNGNDASEAKQTKVCSKTSLK